MRAIQVVEFGGPEQLRPVDVPVPEPGPGEVQVAVDVADVLFLDTQLRAGWGRDYFDLEPPYVPGGGVAGTVAALGEGVEADWLGRRVVGSTSGVGVYRGGGYAERAVVPVGNLHDLPDGVPPAHGLAASDGVMALTRLELAGLRPGDTAVVTAASGSIGVWLVPMLRDTGVTVVAAARGPEKVDLARERGAQLAVDYGLDGWADGLPTGVDAVFDGAGGELGRRAFDLLRRGGRFFSYGGAAGDFPDVTDAAAERGIEVIGIHDRFSAEDGYRAMERALAMLADGTVTPVIGQQAPLDDAAAAHAAMAERRVLGKTVLVVSASGADR